MDLMEDVMIRFAILGLVTCAGFLAIIGIREIWFALIEGRKQASEAK